MKITILNGENSKENGSFTGYVSDISENLQKDNIIDQYNLNEMNLKILHRVLDMLVENAWFMCNKRRCRESI